MHFVDFHVIISYRLDINPTDLGSATLGITDIRKEPIAGKTEEEISMEMTHTYEFNCPCHKSDSNEHSGKRINMYSMKLFFF